ncbi:MAG: DNA translocase FtsK [Candidatus Dormibacteraeota bacterium]|nr:DNA translocase FtsK [Candidatus Dormibacteraeota bacterium]
MSLSPAQRRELVGLSALAIGVICIILLGFPQAPVAHEFAHALAAGVGIGGWIFGLGLVAGGVGLLASRGGERSAGQVLLAVAISALSAISMAAVVSSGQGGMVGRAIGVRIAAWIGAPAALVALGAVGLGGLVVGLGLSPARASAGAASTLRRGLALLFTARQRSGSPPSASAKVRADSADFPVARNPSLMTAPAALVPDAPPTPPEVFERIFEDLEGPIEAPPPVPAVLEVAGALAVAEPAIDHLALGDDEEGEEPEPNWVLPSFDLLDSAQGKRERLRDEIRTRIRTIEATLNNFGVESKVMGVNAGPTVTQYELQPGAGVPVRRILAYQTDLSLALAAPIRIQAPIPGKSAIGIEVPNKAAQLVTLKEIVQAPSFREFKSQLAVALGADVSGHPVLGDLATMPHLLIAGATGSGKSVCINAVLAGLLLQSTPHDLRLILVDPKRVELSNFGGLPHLLVPVVVEPDSAVGALRWAVVEMEQRYKLFAGNGARNITVFNERAPKLGLRTLPKIVIVIDELADLMMVAASEIEDLICRIAQLARAVGIHLIVATQRPSADIITGLIKANIPSRVAFAVSSGVDSRVILDEMGAEKLLGRGDMLYLPIDAGKSTRLQGAYVSDRELDQLIGWWKAQGRPNYQEEILQAAALSAGPADGVVKRDPLFERAGRIVIGEARGSASLLQRKLNVGYTRAARLIDQLAEARVVGPYEGSKSRDVLMNMAELEEMLDAGEEIE